MSTEETSNEAANSNNGHATVKSEEIQDESSLEIPAPTPINGEDAGVHTQQNLTIHSISEVTEAALDKVQGTEGETQEHMTVQSISDGNEANKSADLSALIEAGHQAVTSIPLVAEAHAAVIESQNNSIETQNAPIENKTEVTSESAIDALIPPKVVDSLVIAAEPSPESMQAAAIVAAEQVTSTATEIASINVPVTDSSTDITPISCDSAVPAASEATNVIGSQPVGQAKEVRKRVRRVGKSGPRKSVKVEEGAPPVASTAEGATPKSKSKHDEKWNQMFEKLVEYKKEHGSTLVPQCYDLDPRLGRWVHYQRVEYWIYQQQGNGKITPERIARLEAVGFEWDPQRAQWNNMFQKLQQFTEEHGHCKVPKGYSKDAELANWVRNQRLEHANFIRGKRTRMTSDRLDKLNALGFKWSVSMPHRAKSSDGSPDAKTGAGSRKKAKGTQKKQTSSSKEVENDGIEKPMSEELIAEGEAAASLNPMTETTVEGPSSHVQDLEILQSDELAMHSEQFVAKALNDGQIPLGNGAGAEVVALNVTAPSVVEVATLPITPKEDSDDLLENNQLSAEV